MSLPIPGGRRFGSCRKTEPLVRWVTVVLAVLLGLTHADLWFGRNGVPHVLELRGKLAVRQAANATARKRNEQLAAEVVDLKEGLEMVEEKARLELGMIRPDEIYVQVSAAPPR